MLMRCRDREGVCGSCDAIQYDERTDLADAVSGASLQRQRVLGVGAGLVKCHRGVAQAMAGKVYLGARRMTFTRVYSESACFGKCAATLSVCQRVVEVPEVPLCCCEPGEGDGAGSSEALIGHPQYLLVTSDGLRRLPRLDVDRGLADVAPCFRIGLPTSSTMASAASAC
jgi:hypothetical protein